MIGDGGREYAREKFLAQFEPQGTDFIYRKHRSGVPILVSAAERDRFVTDFMRTIRYGFWAAIGSMTISIFVSIALETSIGRKFDGVDTAIGAGLTLAILICAHLWAWARPLRQLRDRPALGVPRTKEEVRGMVMAETSYSQFGMAGIGIVLLLANVDYQHDLLSGLNIAILAPCATLGAVSIWGVWRKWHFDRENKKL